MFDLHVSKRNVRKSFEKIKDIVPVPNLIEIQSLSFNDFVQLDYLPEERKPIGLEKVLRDIFPIEYEDKLSLEYVSYELGNWSCACGLLKGITNRYQWTCSACKKSGCSYLVHDQQCPYCKKNTASYKVCSHCLSRVIVHVPMTLEECRSTEQSFSMPLRIRIQLITWAKDEEGNKVIRDIKEQDIFFADVPVMVDLYEEHGRFKLGNLGTFLINGVDRVVVSQLQRSPGVIFSQSKKIKDYRGRPYYLSRIIPMRGSWLDFEFDSNDYCYVRIDKKKKVFVTTFLQALGISRDEIISYFYLFDRVEVKNGLFLLKVDDNLIGQRIERGMLPETYEKTLLGKRITKEIINRLQRAGIKELVLKKTSLLNRVFGGDVVDPESGEIFAEQGQIFTEEHYQLFKKIKGLQLSLIQPSGYVLQPTIAMTLAQDRSYSEDEAFKDLHSKVWPGDTSTLKEIKNRFHNLFFNSRYYDLSKVGRIRINRKLELGIPENITILTKEDIIATIRYLVNLRECGEGELDDIDHLSNRRVRLVGELLTNQVYLGFTRIERVVRERFRIQEQHGATMPQDFLNVRPLSVVLREFFGLGQLSQFMDQTNPLAEIAHKRRLSALGPGGVLKDRATYEIRDVHTSHYGRICPIETPEGQTIGLISSLSTYAMVNDLGFVETTYRPVINKKVQDRVIFLDAFEEDKRYIAQADAIAADGKTLKGNRIFARHEGNFLYVDADKIDYVDLSPKQLVSVSSALIPFLEHDDAVRALMGANMQRQAVPLVKPEAPIVGTGMEKEIVKASGAVIISEQAGVVEYVSANKIIVCADKDEFIDIDNWIVNGIKTYHVKKFQRSSYSTWIHQTPIVECGDIVEAGGVLTNAQAIENDELSLGSNLLVAFIPWHGYNFEDAIVLSKRMVTDDTLTSVHIEEFSVDARETKLGPEEITRDIPNISATALESLDSDGIIRVGTRVKPGDILVGKVTLKGDIQYSPEEKLLRAIFGEKSREVRDTSLRVPPGTSGTVIDVKIFSRGGIRKDKRYKEEVAKRVTKLEADCRDHLALLASMVKEQFVVELSGKKPAARIKKGVKSGKFKKELLTQFSLDELLRLKVHDKKVAERVAHLRHIYGNQINLLSNLKEEQINRFKKPDPLPSGVIKMVKVYIAMKRMVSVGDKLAGRHGNKGVVSTIIPREDMPYLADGTPIDIVLNPLGILSRMNIGQILETVLGLIGKKIGEQLKELIKGRGEQAIKTFLKSYFGSKFIDSFEKDQGKEGVIELARKVVQNGLYFKTPVFDGAHFETDIKPMLEKLNLPNTGSFVLYDGLTGKKFDQPVSVGSIYMMKLNHMVDDKLHARSIGPYSLVTQQPLGGKAQLGGQRFGEMEVWALEAYGAAYTLQEMLTYKSDDVNGRHRVYEAIVRGEDIPEPGIPESFNVLVKELQSLGIQVDLFKAGKEKVGE
ncbi:DNA-directed RNA polymerase subunit beta [Candidatus Dependentiae bacterium]|nr:MAG: DNA-directed RNA polymerase subunit beta [Candidatus Dependentiae bacterium]